jgi:hypothetical protein
VTSPTVTITNITNITNITKITNITNIKNKHVYNMYIVGLMQSLLHLNLENNSIKDMKPLSIEETFLKL